MTLWFISLSGIHPSVWAVILTALGGILLKLIEHRLGKRQRPEEARRDLSAEITDLNTRVKEQAERVDKLEEEVTLWRNRYYEEQEHGEILRIQMIQHGLTPPARRPAL